MLKTTNGRFVRHLLYERLDAILHCFENIFDCNLKENYRILIIFGTNIPELSSVNIEPELISVGLLKMNSFNSDYVLALN